MRGVQYAWWWLVLVAGSMSSAGAESCPAGCECAGDDLMWYYCGDYILKARDDGYLEINCQNTELNCSSLPPVDVGRGAPLQRLELTQCVLPPLAGLGACAPRGARGLALQQAPGGLTARNVEGLDLETLFMRFMPDGLRAVPSSPLRSLPSLRRVHLLSGTALPLRGDMFRGAPPLTYLEISMSGVRELPPRAFVGLSSLLTLSLWGNEIGNVSEHAFIGLDSLQQLVLNSNPLEELPPGVFSPTPRLKKLYLDGVTLSELKDGVLEGLEELEELKLSSSVNLSLSPRSLSRLPSLSSLSLSRSRLGSLPPAVFSNTSSVVNLSLSHNMLGSLPERVFSDLGAVVRLDLSWNRLQAVSRELFLGMGALQEVNLDGNGIQELPDRLFSGLPVTSLSLRHNRLHSVSYLSLAGAGALLSLSLSHNRLAWARGREELSSPLHMLHELKHLDLSHNNISCVFSDWRFVLRLETLDLSYNNFTELAQSDVQYFGNIQENKPVTVDFRHNNIRVIEPRATWQPPSPLASLRLGGNPFSCDCLLYSFITDVQDTNQTTYDVTGAVCADPPSLANTSLLSLSVEDLTCPVPADDACDCLIRPALGRVECDCLKLVELPDLEGSGLDNLSLRLRSLLTDLSPLTLPDSVRELNLTGLGLGLVPNMPDSVEMVDLTRNGIKIVPKELLASNATLRLSHNPISCDCWTAEDVALLQNNSWKVVDYANVTCSTGSRVSQVDAAALCNVYRSSVAGLLVALLLLLVVAAAVVLYLHRVEVQVLLYRRGWFLSLLPREDADLHKRHDVFVSFCVEDELFVVSEVLPRLEGRYRLVVQDRDWEVGGTIPDQLHRSVETSRRTLLVLSPRYLSSLWAREALRTLHSQASADRRTRATVLLLGVRRSDLDREVRDLLALSTFVRYGEYMCWDKVRYALPRDGLLRGGEGTGGEKGGGLNVVLNDDGKLVNAGYIKDIV